MRKAFLAVVLSVLVAGLGGIALACPCPPPQPPTSCDVEGSAWGVFSNPVNFSSSKYSISNGDCNSQTSTFKWGDRDRSDRSVLTFKGYDVCAESIDCHAEFKLGKLTFCNDFNTYDWCGHSGTVDLTVNFRLDNPAAPDNPYTFDFTLGILDIKCDADKVTISLPDPSGEYEFDLGDRTYYLQALGFGDCDGINDITCLEVNEPRWCRTDCESAYLWAQLRCEGREPPEEVNPIPEPATMLLLGLGAAGIVIRRRAARRA